MQKWFWLLICGLVVMCVGCGYVPTTEYRRDQSAIANDARLVREFHMAALIGMHISDIQKRAVRVGLDPIVSGGRTAVITSARYTYMLYLDGNGIIESGHVIERGPVFRGAGPTLPGVAPTPALPSHPEYNPHKLRYRTPSIGMSGW